ncbi:drebrin-like protein B [Clytia hemisphaerica]|uniref:Drebrin-like protein n=1 Tax=Clytia hemisphaerica TaxID=252671 RepID=A0A7M5XAR8_9CNID
MSVNLNKYKSDLVKAWEELRDPKSDNDWVIFGYDGQSSDLKVQSQGEDGIVEMIDDFNGGKIQYGGARVIDPNTNLPKIVFINWQGEGVPANVKGKCANHLRDITNLFRGAHVQINARCDDDVEEDVIMEKVKNASGANYSFHKEKPKAFVPQGKIGSVYQRSRPDLDKAFQDKGKFWAQNEKDSKQQKQEEENRLKEEKLKESQKRAERDRKDTEQRERLQKERAQSIDKERESQNSEAKRRAEEEKKRYEASLKESQKDDDEFRRRSDSERRKRIAEANQLIKGRQGVKETFERPSPPAPAKKAAPPPRKAVIPPPVRQPSPEPTREPSPEPPREPTPPPHRDPTPPPHRDPTPPPHREPTPPPTYEPTPPPTYESVSEPSPPPSRQLPPEPQPEPVPEPVVETLAPSAGGGITAKALFDYQAVDGTEISFDPGDLISNIEKIDEGWWRGEAPDQSYGLFPANFVEEITAGGAAEVVAEPEPQPELQPEPAVTSQSRGVCARALYDYQAADDSEITFDPEDVITNIEKIDDGWWRGEAPDGSYGLFPANYVEEI